jgi:hypothetical protein
MVKLIQKTDPKTNIRVLTCYLLPQQSANLQGRLELIEMTIHNQRVANTQKKVSISLRENQTFSSLKKL